MTSYSLSTGACKHRVISDHQCYAKVFLNQSGHGKGNDNMADIDELSNGNKHMAPSPANSYIINIAISYYRICISAI